eukprot:scaffold47313_cov67-Phaeocystis_antarctica.AAC.2
MGRGASSSRKLRAAIIRPGPEKRRWVKALGRHARLHAGPRGSGKDPAVSRPAAAGGARQVPWWTAARAYR